MSSHTIPSHDSQLAYANGRHMGISECLGLVMAVLNQTTEGEDWLRDHGSKLADAVIMLQVQVTCDSILPNQSHESEKLR